MTSPFLVGVTWLALATAYGQQPSSPQLAKDPGPFLPGFGVEEDKGPKPVAGPAPHLPDGRPDFGGNGAWYPGFNGNIAETTWKGVKSADKHVDVPFLSWTLKTYNERVENRAKDDPEAKCLPVGVPRFMFDPYPFQMIQTRNQVVFVFEGDNYLWRIVNIDAAGSMPRISSPLGWATPWVTMRATRWWWTSPVSTGSLGSTKPAMRLQTNCT